MKGKMKKLKQFKEKIENNIIFKILKAIMYIIVVLLLIVIIVQKVTKNKLSVGGFGVYMIVSESMKGEYEIGDILVSKHADADDIKVGDNVTYLGKKGTLKGLIVTHKVIEKEERDGKVYFTTKGIANQIADPEISYDQVYGKVIYKTFILSFLGKLMSKQISYYILFFAVGIVISIEIVSSMFNSDDEKEGNGE